LLVNFCFSSGLIDKLTVSVYGGVPDWGVMETSVHCKYEKTIRCGKAPMKAETSLFDKAILGHRSIVYSTLDAQHVIWCCYILTGGIGDGCILDNRVDCLTAASYSILVKLDHQLEKTIVDSETEMPYHAYLILPSLC
jgi:hypothetical protein